VPVCEETYLLTPAPRASGPHVPDCSVIRFGESAAPRKRTVLCARSCARTAGNPTTRRWDENLGRVALNNLHRSVLPGGRIGPEFPLHRRYSRAPRGARATKRSDLQSGDLATLDRSPGSRHSPDRLRGVRGGPDRAGPERAGLDGARLRSLFAEGPNSRRSSRVT